MRDGYVPNLKIPGKKGPSGKMWLTLLLCVALPPLGLILLWGRARCPLRGKLCMTLVGVAVMVVAMTAYMEWRAGIGYVVPQPPITHTYGVATPAPATAVPAPGYPAVGGDGAQDGIPEGVIPANPLS